MAVCLTALLCGCGPSTEVAADPAQSQAASFAAAQTSTNWSGYVLAGQPLAFTSVSGSWIVPAVDCPAGSSSSSSSWTGIGGGNSIDPTLIQAGTVQECNGGASYSAWWEAIPAPSVTASPNLLGSQGYEVQPGDRITVVIDGGSAVLWNISISNSDRGWTFNTTVPYFAAGETAEWIEEAPLSAGTGGVGQTSLSDFRQVSFSALTVNGANPQLVDADSMAMVDANGDVISNPSRAGKSGDAFDVCFGPGVCLQKTPAEGASAQHPP